jgi:hypothetical protein
MSFNFSPKIVTNGLILCIDPINSSCIISGQTSYKDLSKSNNNGNLVNGAIYDNVFLPNIKTNGISDYVNCNNLTKELFKNNEYSVDVWMKIIGVNRGDIFNIKEFISLPFNIRHDIGLIVGTDNKVSTWTRIDTILNPQAVSVGTITRNTPFCFTLTVNTSGRISMYLNGILDNNTTILTSSLLNIIDDVGSDFWIFSNRSAPTTPSLSLNGSLYSFKLYNRALSQQEITQNYNATKKRYGL